MSDALKPCPFCGGAARIVGNGPYSVTCSCGASVGPLYVVLWTDAIPAWNSRTPEADPWRDLALQFDGHRIEALSMLRFAVRHIEEYATVRDILRGPLAEIKDFLAKPPLSGEAVLASRIAVLAPIGDVQIKEA